MRGTIAAAGILTAEELEKIADALDAIRDDYAQRPPSEIYGRTEAEDIHHFVELELVARIGDLGFKLHTGRSRNEQIATDLRLYVRGRSAVHRRRTSQTGRELLERRPTLRATR